MDIINSSPQQSSQNQPEPVAETPPEPQPQVHEPVVNHVHHGSKKRAFLRIFLTLVIAALAAAGVYFWQQGKTSDLQSQLDAKTAENKTLQQAASTADSAEDADDSDTTAPIAPTSTISEDIIAGDVDNGRTDGKVIIGVIFKTSLNPTAVWVEYGTFPTKLDKSTTKITEGLGEGDPAAAYATGFSSSVPSTQLIPGATYYYRTAATVSGKTLYSGIASFTAKK